VCGRRSGADGEGGGYDVPVIGSGGLQQFEFD
jgi:hypothetical protein